MKYSRYKRGLRNLRKLLYYKDIESDVLGHFGRFPIHVGQNGKVVMYGIWSDKTNNIVAVHNLKGVTLVRPNSIYAGQLLGSTHRVVKASNLGRYRGRVPNYLKIEVKGNVLADSIARKLKANKDVEGKVKIPSMAEVDRDTYRAMLNKLKIIFRELDYPNTYKSLLDSPEFTNDGEADYFNVRVIPDELPRVELRRGRPLVSFDYVDHNWTAPVNPFGRAVVSPPMPNTVWHASTVETDTVDMRDAPRPPWADEPRYRDEYPSTPEQADAMPIFVDEAAFIPDELGIEDINPNSYINF